MICHISAHCALTRVGDEVAIIGAPEALGRWEGRKCVRLRTTVKTFPLWEGDVPIVPPGSEFKLVICRPNGSLQWEPFDGNRSWPVEASERGVVLHLRYGDRSARVEVCATPPPLFLSPVANEAFKPLVLAARAVAPAPKTPFETFASALRAESVASGAPSVSSSSVESSVTPGRSVTPTAGYPTSANHSPPVASPKGTDSSPGTSSSLAARTRPAPIHFNKPDFALRTKRMYGSGGGARTDGSSPKSPQSPGSPRSPSHARFILGHPPGHKIEDHYEIDKAKIGEGGFAVVFKGKTKSCGTDVAIKAIPRGRLVDHATFRREVQTMKMMDHPNVIKLFGTYEDVRSVYLVMELCCGGDLFDRLVEVKSFAESPAAIVVHQILSGVYYMHERQVCHRDLKLENFLFATKEPVERSCLKIIDFGLSAQFQPGKPMTSRVGSADYVAPEVLQGKYDEKSDVWSCGIVLYTMLCGRPAFYSRSDVETLRKVRNDEVTFEGRTWPEVSDGAKQFISRLCTRIPSRRCTAKDALTDRWLVERQISHRAALSAGMLAQLRKFKSQSPFKKAALHMIAWGSLSSDKLQHLTEAFHQLDKNGDGTLTVDELVEGFGKQLGEMPDDLQDVIEALDTNQSGVIDYTEFLAAALDKSMYLDETALAQAFNQFDVDGDGKISEQEVEASMADADDEETRHLAHNIVCQNDDDGDGALTFSDFKHLMERGD